MSKSIFAQIVQQESICLKLRVTEEEYAAAVCALVKIAKKSTSGSRAAAQVLLSAYNGYDYRLDVTDLCLLDICLLDAALKVIRGRVVMGIEPHEVIKDGDAIFLDLGTQWKSLRVKQSKVA